jgi:hypothetical protein
MTGTVALLIVDDTAVLDRADEYDDNEDDKRKRTDE